MKNKTIIFVMALLVFTPLVMAQELQVKAGVNPDSLFYGSDRFFEKARMFFTFGKENKINYGLKISEERIAEIKEMVNQTNQNALEKVISERNRIKNQIELNSVNVSEQMKIQIKQRLETQSKEMVKLQTKTDSMNLKNIISAEIQKTNSLKTRIRGN